MLLAIKRDYYAHYITRDPTYLLKRNVLFAPHARGWEWDLMLALDIIVHYCNRQKINMASILDSHVIRIVLRMAYVGCTGSKDQVAQ